MRAPVLGAIQSASAPARQRFGIRKPIEVALSAAAVLMVVALLFV